ncbi:hypothetical protein [Lysobacter enzymogenes]|uniref:hypothetical protein n=1 Tax=Lysobacter enzymogenes TaxID=69 RepID=UPI001AFC73D6|nr:hypothetical protein [Lysobacter enzymogenes]QQP99472.1 hypothetical protein JHW41_15235 [Lysobacter enzymogenes]
MFATYLKELGSFLLVPMAMIIAGLYLTKGVYGLHRSRSQDRKDFLDLWAKADKADSLWVQVAVRHLFGENLPVPLIRHLIAQPQATRALSDVAFAWRLIDLDEATGELFWRYRRHYSPRVRLWERRFWLGGYFLMAAGALLSVWVGVKVDAKSTVGVMSWLYALLFGVAAYGSLMRGERLSDADVGVPRWTKQMRWRGGSWNSPATGAARRQGRKRRAG